MLKAMGYLSLVFYNLVPGVLAPSATGCLVGADVLLRMSIAAVTIA
jgi:hypothetical protein